MSQSRPGRILSRLEEIAFRKDWDARVVPSPGTGGIRHPSNVASIIGSRPRPEEIEDDEAECTCDNMEHPCSVHDTDMNPRWNRRNVWGVFDNRSQEFVEMSEDTARAYALFVPQDYVLHRKINGIWTQIYT